MLSLSVFVKLQSENTRVGFGGADLSFDANGARFCALSHGHGSAGPRVQQGRQMPFFYQVFFELWCWTFLNGFHENR